MQKATYEFISKQTGNPILEWRTCKRTGEKFPIFPLQKSIEDTLEMTYKQDISPESIFRSICMLRNERNLYKNISTKSGKSVISMYASESEVKVYDTPEFRAEDFIQAGKDIPNSLEEIYTAFQKLMQNTPKQSKINDKNENAEYANYVGSSRNIYLSYCVYYESEDVYYSYYVTPGKDIVDCFYIQKSDVCYECINTFNSYGCSFCYNINNSQNCYFSTDLDNCQHCLFCSNLRDKKYYIHNKEYNKEAFEIFFANMKQEMKRNSGLRQQIATYENVLASAIYKNVNQVNCEDCIGDALVNSRKSMLAFDSYEINESYNVRGGQIEKSLNMIGGCASYVANSVRIGAGGTGESSSKILGSYNIYTSHNIISCHDLVGCNNMIFCCGLKNKEYCILNKQFSKEEREKIANQIIKQMKSIGVYGAPPSHELSPFPYNDTIANDFFPAKPEQLTILEPEKFISDAILDLGGTEKIKIKRRTRDHDVTVPENIETISAKDLSDNIDDISDEILSKAIICEVSGSPFRIVGPELTFYRKHGLPLPRRHPNIRHQERRARRPQRNLHLRNCSKCGIETLSVYPQDSALKVYCEACYNKEIYG